jgi:shikimate kinase
VVIILVGPGGVGKTAVRDYLAAQFAYVSLGPDDFEDRWLSVVRALSLSKGGVIVECNRIPRAILKRMGNAKVVKLRAPLETLRRRMLERGDSFEEVKVRVNEARDERPSLYADVKADLVVDTDSESAEEVGERIIQFLGIKMAALPYFAVGGD